MEGSELTSKFEGRTPMANIEYFDNKMKTERVAVQARAATGAEIQPASLIRAGHGIPVDLGATTFELLTSPKEDTYWVIKATLHPDENDT
jgi:hypothetical protein